jgi:glycosyltransferase involved in cell wall biosynthesis
MKLSAAIIVKNEEACFEKCLKSIKDIDEIVVVDTGSTDNTIEIAKRYTDKIYHFKWCDDFAKARNFAKSKCTGDWIFTIDADHQLLTSMDKFKVEVEKANEKSLYIKSKAGTGWNYRAAIYKNDPDIQWVGKVHETINVKTHQVADAEIHYDYSVNHKNDPERNLRILLTMEQTPRTLFYTGREYYDLRQFEKAIEMFDKYLKVSTWLSERAEAYYSKALCLWFLYRGDEARTTIFEAIKINPEMKKALILCSQMHYEPWKSKWLHLSKAANNQDVIFK